MMGYKSELAARIKQCIAKYGQDDSFSEKTGIPKRTLGNYTSGKSEPKAHALAAIAEISGVSLEWLATGRGTQDRGLGNARQVSSPSEISENSGLKPIPVMNVMASAGGGAVALDHEQAVSYLAVDPAWVRSTYGLQASDLFILPSMGESMEPTIKAGEYLLASRAEHHIKPGDGIYVVRVEGNVLVKRLQPLPGRKIKVSSDNPSYDPYVIDEHNGHDFAILGKVFVTMRHI